MVKNKNNELIDNTKELKIGMRKGRPSSFFLFIIFVVLFIFVKKKWEPCPFEMMFIIIFPLICLLSPFGLYSTCLSTHTHIHTLSTCTSCYRREWVWMSNKLKQINQSTRMSDQAHIRKNFLVVVFSLCLRFWSCAAIWKLFELTSASRARAAHRSR